MIRSNDVMLGMPHDVAGFALLQCILAERLGVKPGIYSHSISNAHVYDIHYAAAEEIMSRQNNHPKVTLEVPANTFARIENRDPAIAKELIDQLTSQYQPMDAIKGLQIVL
jgi:thymidylate synthase